MLEGDIGDQAPKDSRSYLWLAIGTALGFLWTMPLTWWLTPIFNLRFTRTQKVWRGFILAWIAGCVTVGVTQYAMLNALMPSPLPIYLITVAITALIFTLPYLADRLLAPRIPGFAGTLVFPLALTAIDFLSAKANPLGSVGAQAYFQYGNLTLMQLLSITGMWGVTFLVSWLGSVVNWMWEREFALPRILRGAAIYGGILLAVILYGGIRLTLAPDPGGTVRIHGITAVDMRQNWSRLRQIGNEDWEAMRALAADYQNLYLAETLREAQAGAQVVHWPEMAVMVPGEDEAAFLTKAQEVAREQGIYLAAGMGTVFKDERPWENKLLLIDPGGSVVLEHHKYALVSMEGTKGGDGILRTVETPFGLVSGVVCNDTNHEEIVTQAGRNGTDILFAPSLELREIDPIHAHMAAYRAIENGVTLVRQADNGLSIVVDPYGRVLASVDHFAATERVMVAQVPVKYRAFTLYPLIGDLFAWLSITGFGVMTLFVAFKGRGARRGRRVGAGTPA